jgi:hypothetical protein
MAAQAVVGLLPKEEQKLPRVLVPPGDPSWIHPNNGKCCGRVHAPTLHAHMLWAVALAAVGRARVLGPLEAFSILS